MRFATIKAFAGDVEVGEVAAVLTSKGLVPVKSINDKTDSAWKTDLFSIISSGEIPQLVAWYNAGGKEELEKMDDVTVPYDKAVYGPLYRTPEKLFCIALNYQGEADCVNDTVPLDVPSSFYKAQSSIAAPGEPIIIPRLAKEIDEGAGDYAKQLDAESELVVIMGKGGHDIPKEKWLDYVAGFTTSIECTVMDLFYKGLRKLCISKSYKSHFIFGPVMITPDEVGDIMQAKIRTIQNGKIIGENTVGNMMFPPDFLVSFHSTIWDWKPGDVISAGTPKGAFINEGDVITTEIDGFTPVTAEVKKA